MNSFDKLYSENYQKVYRVALKMSGDTENALDIVQEVFISLFDSMQNGIEILYPATWLYRVAVNKSCDSLRKKKRFEPLEIVINRGIHDEPIEKKELKEKVEKALLDLRPRERILMVLYSEGLSYREISEVSGVKLQSVGKTISRILLKLERKLKCLDHELY